ncbi:MAG: acetate--CoA ligase [Planctomycetota bacterium]|nr:acetate--CoA ligase [Planctomycetota bacterium]
MPDRHATGSSQIESVLHEHRVFPPRPEASAGAHVRSLEQYRELHRRSISDAEGFWGEMARELTWFTPWGRVLEWKAPDARWFVGAKTNVSFNCLDRQLEAGLGDQVALIWEGEPASAQPEVRRLTYAQLHREVCKLANVLRALGVGKGDVVTIYMPMVPEAAIAMLACARIGAPHSVIFGGFSAQAIADRVYDAGSKLIITADGGFRRGVQVPLKENVDAAMNQMSVSGACPVRNVIVFERTGQSIAWHHAPSASHGNKRDHWWHDLMLAASDVCPAEPMDSEDMLFVLYTSGSTGKPKGIIHTTGGYMVQAYCTSKYTFDLHPGTGQVMWCTADIGWVTGHSYVVYGMLPNRVPTLMYEGAPNFPTAARFWQMIERHGVTHFYTAPTAIRAFMRWGDEHPRSADLSSLRVLGTVGEPINPEAWMWYHRVIGGERCPIVDTWWQTETGGHMITPLPGATPTKPGSCTLPFFGVDAAIVDEKGQEMPANTGGLLAIRKPWPGMLRGVLNDRDRYIKTYWSDIRTPSGEVYYKAGDGARRDEDGYFWVMGRIDDVINVSGHRLGTMEIESALVSHESVVEAAVVGVPHELKGTGIAAFCTLAPGHAPTEALRESLRAHVSKEIGALAKPDTIRFTDALPKTRSGKIMRRLLRSIASGEERIAQDTTTLEDYSILAKLRESQE